MFITAARGRQQNASIHASYTASLYLCLPIFFVRRRRREEGKGQFFWEAKGERERKRKGRTLEFEREVIGEMAALVVSSKKEDGIGEVDLERPEVENTLIFVERREEGGRGELRVGRRESRRRTSMEK